MPKTFSQIVSTPESTADREVSGYVNEHQFGFFETPHARAEQEDALSWRTLHSHDLTPTEALEQLTASEIGYRLWTSYQLLDQQSLEQKLQGGTTASTTIYDGKGNLITATLADAAAFVAVYDKNSKVLGVLRLNSRTHKATDPDEIERITAAGGLVLWGRVDGSLAVSRAIGDHELKARGVCSEATIDITHMNQITKQLKIKLENIGNIQVISTCDGFTDAADGQSKENHEQFLLETLQKMDSPGNITEEELAKTLVTEAKQRSYDNITVAIQSITADKTFQAFLLGVYDGHAGSNISSYVATNIADIFIEQCSLAADTYAKQVLSVHAKIDIYKRDNPETIPTLFTATALPVVKSSEPVFQQVVTMASPTIPDKPTWVASKDAPVTTVVYQEPPTFSLNRVVAVSASVDDIQTHLIDNPLLALYIRVPGDIEGMKVKLEQKYQVVDGTQYVPLEVADHVPAHLMRQPGPTAGTHHRSLFDHFKLMRRHNTPLFPEFNGLLETLERYRKYHDKKISKLLLKVFGASLTEEHRAIHNAIEHFIEFIKIGKPGLTEQDKILLNRGELHTEISRWEMRNGKSIVELFEAHDKQAIPHTYYLQ